MKGTTSSWGCPLSSPMPCHLPITYELSVPAISPKIGNEERIHVYYARGEDDPNFYRRCYWLLDNNHSSHQLPSHVANVFISWKLEHIVLVHYRQTLENVPALVEYKEPFYLAGMMSDSSPLTPVNSISGSMQSDSSGSAAMSEEINSREDQAIFTGSGIFLSKKETGLHIKELSLHDINNLGWAELALASEYIEPCMGKADGALDSSDSVQFKAISSIHDQGGTEYLETPDDQGLPSVLLNTSNLKMMSQIVSDGPKMFDDDIFNNKNGFEQWDSLKKDSFGTLEAPLISNGNGSNLFRAMDQSSVLQQIFTINEVSPEWGYSTVETKVVVIGNFAASHKHLESSSIYCVFGELCVGMQMVQSGVYRCIALPQMPGKVDAFLSLDGQTPISQVITFHYRHVPAVQLNDGVTSKDANGEEKFRDVMAQKRLAHLLFSTSDSMPLFSSKMLPKAIKEAQRVAQITSPYIENDWKELLKLDCKNEITFYQACEDLLELVFKNKLQEWLMKKIAEGCKITTRDSQGQGVIHLCTILDYTWAVSLYSLSGFSLDFRDAYGWTALHWAAHLGREKMVATLIYAGANPSLVTDPTPENPGGLTAADLASKGGHDGLAAYLAEKGLTAHFEAMSLSGNVPSSVLRVSKDQVNLEDLHYEMLSEQEVCLKESLEAYRNAADAADRIQAAFRERTLKLQTESVQLANPQMEASQIVAALRIQHAYRNYNRRRLMKAAARIQSHFRTWRIRKDFLNMRRQVIKIQAAVRGHQVRKQYRKIVWSVGVLEKAVLRWRLKRKGLRGMQVKAMEVGRANNLEESTSTEEDFFKISRKHAEERVQRSVVRVQSMFRSYQAQQQYRRLKLAQEQAKLEFSLNGDSKFL
ncbi:calmodulin-binding transcription activator CBT-like isoform X1 [Dendrobium catenatum]|uniref:calmodulin-binding transcription activator CBT-like isoform X1 n=1 Tax=Dendrobium catenatum TaxID=906689 RepID=UPI0010A07A55|nr:calmodulin-binding transcription activator CBT-like isoform X1 [Dendrobium catenatum]